MPRVARGWRVTVRDGPRVTRRRAGSLGAALALVGRAGPDPASGSRRGPGALPARALTPRQQVAGRVELSGPRVRAGADVRGDGAAEAWTGRLTRRVVARRTARRPTPRCGAPSCPAAAAQTRSGAATPR